MNILNKRPVVSKDIFIKIDNNKVLLIDSERANWVVVSQPLAEIILNCDGSISIEEIVNELNIKCSKEFSQKLLSCFDKLYGLNFINDNGGNIIEQSKALDSVYFNLTKNCNLKCIYCYADAGGNATKNAKDQSLGFWKRTIDQLYNLNKNATINFTGGEPTIYKYFWNVVEYAKDKGLNLLLITNGSNSKDEDIQKYLNYFSSIEVSIDSLREEVNSLTRGKDSLFSAQKFIDTLIEKGVQPTILVVVSKYNESYLYEINDKYKSSAKIKYQPMYNMGRGDKFESIRMTGKEYYNILKSQNIERMKGDITYKRNMKYVWCGMGLNVLSIEANGEVYPCQLMHHENFKLGDLNNQSLEELWMNSPYKDHSVDLIEGCKSCELKYICSAPCRARAFYVLGSIYKKDPLCPDFIKKSIYDNLFEI
ncbi:MAG: radical SAM protein [Candidatus Contubernalis sp.]|nr:radical SAM protein [Candidatus Contubernalis sp.]